ncbi:TPA: restriction endonuclease subunit S [Citrobacter braakii]|uniref:restriction endonuclease subunit S n=1 Tax=Citrobacter TaxID=544 RepID=UPI0023B0D431|nr:MULTISPECIES: restriction endonuclease subunit S [Citrobacter]MDM3337424.1 restriction endonuclease subunit S [Citrobacter sp. Cb043]HEB0894696.1 restriction endonuclease subunit S [Citrobacter braakii]
MSSETLENLSIKLIDGDRGKNYPKQSDFFDKSDCLFLSAKNVTKNGFEFADCLYISKEKDEQLRAGKLERNDIVLTTRGTIGNSGLYDSSININNVRINSGMIILRPDTSIWNPRFLYFLLNSDLVEKQILALTSGSAVPQLPARDLRKFILPKVPLGKQNKIVEVIGGIVDKAKSNSAINQTLEQMAQALFKSWFVDFEPVKAKIAVLEAGGSQEDATLAAMTVISGKDTDALVVFECEHPQQYAELKATAELFPSAMQESELGEIPEGWRSGSVTNVTDKVFSGGTPTTTKSEYWNGEFHWFSSGETRNSVITNTEKTITKLGVEQSSTKESVLGDVLIASAGQGHTRGQTSLNMINTYINQSVVAVRPKKTIFTCWLYMNLRSRYEEMRAISDSHSSRGSLTTKLVSGMPVVIPGEKILQKFEKSIFPLFDSVKHSQREIDSLTQLRDTLLPKLLSGEITLPEAEQAVSEAEHV